MEKEIFEFVDYMVGSDYERSYNIRFQVENLLIGWNGYDSNYGYNENENIFQREIKFWQVEDPILGGPFVLPLNKDHFSGKNIKIWRDFSFGIDFSVSHSDFDPVSYNMRAIKDKAAVIMKIIKDNYGDHGKVRIYPLYRPNPDIGYQHLLRTDIYSSIIPDSKPIIPNNVKKDARRFDIDLSDSSVQQKLEHIARLALGFIEPNAKSPFTKDFLFIMTVENFGDIPIYEYNKMVCAFDRHRFYNPEEILSSGSGLIGKYKPLKITEFEEGINIKGNYMKIWESSLFVTSNIKYLFPSSYKVWW